MNTPRCIAMMCKSDRTIAGRIAVVIAVVLGVSPSIAFGQPELGGFVEAIQVQRIEYNPVLDPDRDISNWNAPRSEVRAQITLRDSRERSDLFIRLDIIGDNVRVRIGQSNRVIVDLREAYFKLRATEWLDLKIGRQVATWGTGDFVFANDLFAKDWEAFFLGLDDSYLKPPQDLLRASVYAGGVTFETAISPRFTPDILPKSLRMSMYDPARRRIVNGGPFTFGNWNLERFARVTSMIGSTEWALYGYWGQWPIPVGIVLSGYTYYPGLASWGASIRRPIGSVLMHAEGAVYHSLDDTHRTNPMIANTEVRGFVGGEKNLGSDWTIGSQYFFIWMQQYERYKATLPMGVPIFDELRSTITARIQKSSMNQTLLISVFGFWGVTDRDWHLRPSVAYLFDDAIRITVGGSLVNGDLPYTTFGQFRDNSNIFARMRYSF